MTAPNMSTTSTSSSVKPEGRGVAARTGKREALVAEVAVLAIAAFLAVGAQRHEVEGLALPGHRVAVVVAPRILQVRVLGVGPVPPVDSGGLLHERLQRVGVAADFELVELDRG